MAKTIYVVDDSASMRTMLALTLRGAGYEVVESKDGSEALQRLSTGKADVVLTDLNMPILDGIGLVKALRAQPATKHIPVLILTTESQANRKAEGKSAGATGWLVKPFNPEQLLTAVSKVL